MYRGMKKSRNKTTEQVTQGRGGPKNQKQRPPPGRFNGRGIQGLLRGKGEIKCYRCGKEGHFKRDAFVLSEGKKKKSYFSWPLMRKRGGSGALLHWRVLPTALDKFRDRTWERRGHLPDRLWSGAFLSCHPPYLPLSSEHLLVSGVKGEGFNVHL